MRKDMNKVLTTRPRFGGNTTRMRKTFDQKNTPKERRFVPGRKDAVDDYSPKRESMRRRHRTDGDSKEFSDLINPLRRYLRKQVGRPWDEVWSDICRGLAGGGLALEHVKDHVKWEVDGIPHSGHCYFRHDDWYKPGSGVVYVDSNGILRANPNK